MQIARVCGTLVSTLKHPALGGRKTMALDVVEAGPGDWVLVLDEGSSASQVLGIPRGPVRTVVVGVLDAVESGPGEAIQEDTKG